MQTVKVSGSSDIIKVSAQASSEAVCLGGCGKRGADGDQCPVWPEGQKSAVGVECNCCDECRSVCGTY